jgi:hypothetical protein
LHYLDQYDQRIERRARHLHQLGPRAISELLLKAVAENDDVPWLLVRLERYRRCNPMVLCAVGGGRFPRCPFI